MGAVAVPGGGEGGGCLSVPRPVGADGVAAECRAGGGGGGRRARAKIRRYAAANRLNRLGTLTYRGRGLPRPGRGCAAIWRGSSASCGRGLAAGRFPYVWVPQWHPGGHGLHAHFAVGRFVPRAADRAVPGGTGFVHIKLLDGLPVGSGALAEARLAARYLARYVGRDVEDERRLAGLHRYEVAQGFQPAKVECYGALGRGRDRARLRLHGSRAGAGLAVVECGGVAWAARLLGAVGLTSYKARAHGVGRTYLRWTRASRSSSSDPLALAKVAELLAQGRQTRRQARLVEAVVAAPAGADDDVIERRRRRSRAAG